MLIAKNVEAGCLVARFTHSDPGKWTSWPPHQHFLWAMAAHCEVEDRQFGVVNIQPGFQQDGFGLETSRK